MNKTSIQFTFSSHDKEELMTFHKYCLEQYTNMENDIEDEDTMFNETENQVFSVVGDEEFEKPSFLMILRGTSELIDEKDYLVHEVIRTEYPSIDVNMTVSISGSDSYSIDIPLYYLVIGKDVFPIRDHADEYDKKDKVYTKLSQQITNLPTPTLYSLSEYVSDVLRMPYDVLEIWPKKRILATNVSDFDIWLDKFVKKYPSMPFGRPNKPNEEVEDNVICYGDYISNTINYEHNTKIDDIYLFGASLNCQQYL